MQTSLQLFDYYPNAMLFLRSESSGWIDADALHIAPFLCSADFRHQVVSHDQRLDSISGRFFAG